MVSHRIVDALGIVLRELFYFGVFPYEVNCSELFLIKYFYEHLTFSSVLMQIYCK